MADGRTVRELVQHLAGTHENDFFSIADATIEDIDLENRTCTVTLVDSSKPITRDDIRLMSSIDDGFLIIPTIGTTVTIAFSTFTSPVIISYSGFDSLVLKGGDLGGLAIVPVLISKINALENLLNDLISKFNEHTHNVTAVGAPTGPSLNQETTTLTPTKRSEIENTSITHGS